MSQSGIFIYLFVAVFISVTKTLISLLSVRFMFWTLIKNIRDELFSPFDFRTCSNTMQWTWPIIIFMVIKVYCAYLQGRTRSRCWAICWSCRCFCFQSVTNEIFDPAADIPSRKQDYFPHVISALTHSLQSLFTLKQNISSFYDEFTFSS